MGRVLAGLIFTGMLSLAVPARAGDLSLSGGMRSLDADGVTRTQTLAGLTWSSDLSEARGSSISVRMAFGSQPNQTPWSASTLRLGYDSGRVGGEAGVYVSAQLAATGQSYVYPSAVAWISPLQHFQIFTSLLEDPFLDTREAGFVRAGTRWSGSRLRFSSSLVLDTLPNTVMPQIDAELQVADGYWIGGVARVAIPGGETDVAAGSLRFVRRF